MAPAPVVAGPAISPTPASSSQRSLGPLIALVGFVLLGVVGGLAFIMAQGAGTPAGTMSALTSPAVPPTASPTAPPTPDLLFTAATQFRTFEDAYLNAYDALHDTLPATGQFASYPQARSYYGTEVQNLRRFEASLRGMTFPTDVDPDAQTLLERISKLATLMDELAATKKEAAGWEINKKILKARDAMHAARVVVGEDLGRTYAPTPKPTMKPTPKPTMKPTPKPTANPLAGTTALIDFRMRQRQGAQELLGIISDLGTDNDLGDDAAFRSDGARLEKRANTEVKWLKARRPQPCYASIWKKQLVYLGDLVKSGRYAEAGNKVASADYLGLAAEHVPDINDNEMIDRCAANPAKPG